MFFTTFFTTTTSNISNYPTTTIFLIYLYVIPYCLYFAYKLRYIDYFNLRKKIFIMGYFYHYFGVMAISILFTNIYDAMIAIFSLIIHFVIFYKQDRYLNDLNRLNNMNINNDINNHQNKMITELTNEYIKHEPLNKPTIEDNCIISQHPHGVFGISGLILMESQNLNKKSTWLVVSTLLFYTPCFAHIIPNTNVLKCSKPVIKTLLKRGCNVIIITGGEEEMMRSTPQTDHVYIKRTGMFRIAIEENKPIVPVICYGESDVFNNLNVLWFRKLLKKLIGTSFIFPFGNFPYILHPIKADVKVCYCDPIYPPKYIDSNIN